MKIYSWELINIMLVFPGIFAFTLIIEGIYKVRSYNIKGFISLAMGIVLFAVLTYSFFFFSIKK